MSLQFLGIVSMIKINDIKIVTFDEICSKFNIMYYFYLNIKINYRENLLIFYDYTSHFVLHILYFKTHYNIGITLNLRTVIYDFFSHFLKIKGKIIKKNGKCL